MEKFSQFRDKGSGLAPYLPIPTDQPPLTTLPFHIFLFAVRLPFLLAFCLSYFFFLQWLPIGAIGKKASLWCIIGVPGIWWVDLQIDGVKRGTLNSQKDRFPQEGAILASSWTSPIDPIYLAAIFDPIFTASYPDSRQVRRISLLEAVLASLFYPRETPPSNAKMIELETLTKQNPKRYIVVFPECTTSNARGILPFSPSLLSASPKTKIYPVSLKYTPADITTPIPHAYFRFLWNLCSKPTHNLRTRIAEYVHKPSVTLSEATSSAVDSKTLMDEAAAPSGEGSGSTLTKDERAFLDKIAEALARLGRVKRVGLGVVDKQEFVAMWTKARK